MALKYNPVTNQFDEVGDPPIQSATSFTIQAGSQVDSAIPETDFRSILVEIPRDPIKETIIGTIDPTNVSTGDANLFNANYTDLCYNNSSQGTTNKPLPAVDLGSSKEINVVSLWWWNATYTAINYKIQGSNNGTTWIDLATNLSSNVAGRQDLGVNAQVRYVRMFCVTGRNTSWVVLSEVEIYSTSSQVDQLINPNDDLVVVSVNANNRIELENKSNQTIKVIVKH